MLAADGDLPATVDHTYPLTVVVDDAHRRQAAGGLTGRVVLVA